MVGGTIDAVVAANFQEEYFRLLTQGYIDIDGYMALSQATGVPIDEPTAQKVYAHILTKGFSVSANRRGGGVFPSNLEEEIFYIGNLEKRLGVTLQFTDATIREVYGRSLSLERPSSADLKKAIIFLQAPPPSDLVAAAYSRMVSPSSGELYVAAVEDLHRITGQ